jgi:hypothetical protein
MQSSVAAIRRGRLQAHFVTSHGHHRFRRYGLSDPTRGRLVPAHRPLRDAGSRVLGLGHLRRGDRMTWTRPTFPVRRDGVTPSAAWRD